MCDARACRRRSGSADASAAACRRGRAVAAPRPRRGGARPRTRRAAARRRAARGSRGSASGRSASASPRRARSGSARSSPARCDTLARAPSEAASAALPSGMFSSTTAGTSSTRSASRQAGEQVALVRARRCRRRRRASSSDRLAIDAAPSRRPLLRQVKLRGARERRQRAGVPAQRLVLEQSHACSRRSPPARSGRRSARHRRPPRRAPSSTLAQTGVPHAIASSAGSPNPSYRDGNASSSAAV